MSGTNGQPYYLRRVSLIIGDSDGKALDLSAAHFRFVTNIATVETPNILKLHIWNLAEATVQKLTAQKNGTYEYTQVVLQAGYRDGPYGVIFKGTVVYMRHGRENPVDTYLDIDVSDGDMAYNYGQVNTSLPPNCTLSDAAEAAAQSLIARGATAANAPPDLPATAFPRGLALYGMSRDLMHEIATPAGIQWSLLQGQIAWIPQADPLPTVYELNSGTGMIGIPEQTIYGINVRTLINPNIKLGITLHINQADIRQQELNQSITGVTGNAYIAPINKDGLYKILALSYSGDTRGTEWYCNVVCNDINQPVSFGAVQAGWL
jgi:hypothetical protein